MRKNVLFCWFIIILLWASLIFLIFEKSTEAEIALSNMQVYFSKIYGSLINDQPQNDLSLPETWYYTCEEGFRLIPDCKTGLESGIEGLKSYFIKINSDGFRGREYAVKKPVGTFRVIVLGDSFAFGWGLNLEETFCYRLEKILNENISNKHFEVLNFGVPGMNTVQEVEYFKEKALKYNPDLVIIGFLDNDDESFEFYSILENCTDRGKERSIKRDQLKSNPNLKNIEFVKRPLGELMNISEKYNFKILIYAFELEDYQEDFFKTFEKSNNNIYFEKASFSFTESREFYLHPLELHPSSLANELYAQEIYEAIDKYSLLQH